MKKTSTYALAFSGICIAMNIVLGIITKALGIPLYLDTLGTMLSAAVLGPVPGMVVGTLTNVITGLIYSVSDIPFFIVNLAVGLITGLVVKKWNYSIVTAVILGLVLAAVCPAIGTPIGMFVYGGFNGSFSDVLVMSLVEGGKSIFQASFLRNIASNLIDKVGTAVIAWILLKALSQKFYANFGKEKLQIVK
ncbi:MAG: ECF transporter S component [Bacillota bacterium]|nr:ECF transporter S component [Bacillota bacterium]